MLNGGLGLTRSVLNLKVDQYAPPPWPPAQVTLSAEAEALALPLPCTGMMTAASMQSLGECQLSRSDLQVSCWVTSGLSNLRRAGDEADCRQQPGTINIILHVNQALADAAMAEALILLTEAKVTAVRDLALLSPVSERPASGTGTDSHAVLCPVAPPAGPAPHEFCGKHTLLGELIGRAVLNACTHSLNQCIRAMSKACD
ncbi:adenosylcobinamide amidohydrolase [Thalassolituus sp. LLYu03]|uniref:adenosylcobinamide amidohydrolase n=1 Tax=Thalassolituus sp. LLYu03 TaxID=3421656 RepID=UPI003D2D2475